MSWIPVFGVLCVLHARDLSSQFAYGVVWETSLNLDITAFIILLFYALSFFCLALEILPYPRP